MEKTEESWKNILWLTFNQALFFILNADLGGVCKWKGFGPVASETFPKSCTRLYRGHMPSSLVIPSKQLVAKGISF
jgi:hypothetical protein